MDLDWINYPTIALLIKRADSPFALMAPPRGTDGWSGTGGFQNADEAFNFEQKADPKFYSSNIQPRLDEAAKGEAFGGSIPSVASLTTSALVDGGVNAVARRVLPTATTALGRFATGQFTGGSMLGLPGLAVSLPAQAFASDAVQGWAADKMYGANPQTYQEQAKEKLRRDLSALSASKYSMGYNPIQQALNAANDNPYARNGAAGAGLGAAGGAALGSMAGHPWLGAALGALGGGLAGGMSPTAGSGLWSRIYNSAYRSAGKLNGVY